MPDHAEDGREARDPYARGDTESRGAFSWNRDRDGGSLSKPDSDGRRTAGRAHSGAFDL